MERRSFLQNLTVAGTALSASVYRAPALAPTKNPTDKIGVASIGVGTQGHRLLQAMQAVEGTEIRIICDLYKGNIERAKRLCNNPKVRFVKEWERVVSDPDIDAVIVAVPDFWHAPIVTAAAAAKKDIYVEKGWCTKLEDAKKMRKAVKENRVIMQLGHHYNSLPTFHKAREIFRSGAMGKTPVVRTFIDRANPHPEWKFYTDYSITQMPKDAGPDTIDWNRFIANAPKRPFDAERFFTWRCYWDYGTGIAGDLLSHLWDGANMVMDLGIPESAVTQGGTYFWEGDREVPDMWHVSFDYPAKKTAFTFASSFHSRHVGEMVQILGREMTLEVAPDFCRTYSAEWKPDYYEKVMAARRVSAEARKAAQSLGLKPMETAVPPDYAFHEGELKVSSHMQNFVDCIRSRELPRCHVDRAFEEAVAMLMSVEAFRRDKKVRWDTKKEQIV